MKKGFTLIELLAVIIVLSVVALITTPIVLDVVNNSKESSRISSVNSLIDATRLYMNEAMLDSSIDLSGNLLETINNRVKGTKPSEGEIKVNGNNIAIAVKIDGYCYVKEYSDSEIKKVNDDDCFISIEATCYGEETNVLDSIEINYAGCVANLNSLFETSYTNEELDKFCKNEEKISDDSMSFYLKDLMMYAYMIGQDMSNFTSIININYKKECQTCFEYEKEETKYDFDINYDVCVANLDGMVENVSSWCNGSSEVILTGTDGDGIKGESLTLKELCNKNLNSLGEAMSLGIIENIRFDKQTETTITSYLCHEGNSKELPVITDLVIPTTINGLKVTELGRLSFVEGLTKINFNRARYLTRIGDMAFAGVYSLTGELDLSKTRVKTIGFAAFGCMDTLCFAPQFTSIKFPTTIEEIGKEAFGHNQLRGELDLSNLTNLTTIGGRAFESNQITSVKLPNSVATIGSWAFSDNSNLTLIEIDNIKDAISGSPWGSNATVTWLRDSE